MKSNDYQLFDFFHTNRNLNERSVKNLMQSIMKIGYIEAKPILVNKEHMIIDGQHRFEACRRLNLPIYYEVINIDPNQAMVELNANQQMWKLFDYVHSYASLGIECYQKLIEFAEMYKLGDTNSMNILFKSFGKAAKVRNGHIFDLNPHADDIADFVISTGKFLNFYKSTHYVSAVIIMFDKIEQKQIDKIHKEFISYKQQVKVTDYLAMFENIYNRNIKLQSKQISLKIN